MIPEEMSDGVSIHTIVGEGGSIQLKTDVEYSDISLEKGVNWKKTVLEGMRGFVYVVEGSLMLNGETLHAGQAAFIEQEMELELLAGDASSRVMWCFGRPHGEPIYQHGPFVD